MGSPETYSAPQSKFKKDFSDIIVVLDRSGSMDACKSDVIGGFNSFLKEQQDAEGTANISLYQFDNFYETVFENKDVKMAQPLDDKTFVPRGGTALYDAIGKTIANFRAKYEAAQFGEVPEKVFFVIITDGEENASFEYSFEQISKMIEKQKQNDQWIFVFLGADIKAVEIARSAGISMNNTMQYTENSAGYQALYCATGKNIKNMRALKGHAKEVVVDGVLTNLAEADFFVKEDFDAQEKAKTTT